MQLNSPSSIDQPFPIKRGQFAIAILAILALMGLWTISDPSRLAASGILTAGDYVGGAFCHRIPVRSFTVMGRPIGLCARCSGMYLGFFLYFALVTISGREKWTTFSPVWILVTMAGFIAIMGVDGINSYSHFFPNAPHLYTPNNTLRLFTGLGTGLAIGTFIVPAVAQTLWTFNAQVQKAAVGTLPEFLGLITITVLAGLILLMEIPIATYIMAILSILGLLFILTGIFTILLMLLTKRENSLSRGLQAIPPLSIGFIIACLVATGLVTARIMFIGTIHGIPGLG